MRKIYVDLSQMASNGGGFIRYCIVLSKALNKIDNYDFIFLIPKQLSAKMEKVISNHTLKLISGSGIWLWIKRELFFLNKKFCLFPGNYTTLINFGKRNILVIHDLKFIQAPSFLTYKTRLMRKILVSYSISCSEVIVSISKFTAQSILKYFDRKSSTIYTPIVPVFEIDNKHQSGYFLSVLTSHKHKNFKTLIEIFKKLPNENLILVGNFTSNLSNVKILNNISDDLLFNLYKNCKVFIFPSLYEGLGQPVIEASYFNKPIICSNLPPLLEITNNKAIYIDNPMDIEEWLTKIKMIKSKHFSYKNDIFFTESKFINKLKKILNETDNTRPKKW